MQLRFDIGHIGELWGPQTMNTLGLIRRNSETFQLLLTVPIGRLLAD